MKYLSSFSKLAFLFTILGFLSSCATIRQGEVGVKRTFGNYSDKPFTGGLKFFNPLTSVIEKISTQTQNLEVELSIPSKEGLNIRSEVSILYNINPRQAPEILRTIGQDYENALILPIFRSSVADVSSRFFAKDMHTGERGKIEIEIKDQMMKLLDGRGIEVEAVLLKSIILPPSIAKAIEEKLQAEQQAQRMQFVLLQAKQEAEQKIIAAQGIRDAQNIISQGLDAKILQFKSIEAFLELAKSPNTKIIISDGRLPMQYDVENDESNISRTTSIRQ